MRHTPIKLNFAQFSARSIPEGSVFDRTQFDFVTNAVKWIAMWLAYVLYRSGLTANQIDLIGVGVSVASFTALSTASDGPSMLPVYGMIGLAFHVVLDFADGPVARAAGTSSAVGEHFDNFGGDLDRLMMFVVLGLYTDSRPMLLATAAAAAVFMIFLPNTVKLLADSPSARFFIRVYTGRYSLLGCRFMLAVLPTSLVAVALFSTALTLVATAMAILYIAGAGLWLLVCVLMPRPTAES